MSNWNRSLDALIRLAGRRHRKPTKMPPVGDSPDDARHENLSLVVLVQEVTELCEKGNRRKPVVPYAKGASITLVHQGGGKEEGGGGQKANVASCRFPTQFTCRVRNFFFSSPRPYTSSSKP